MAKNGNVNFWHYGPQTQPSGAELLQSQKRNNFAAQARNSQKPLSAENMAGKLSAQAKPQKPQAPKDAWIGLSRTIKKLGISRNSLSPATAGKLNRNAAPQMPEKPTSVPNVGPVQETEPAKPLERKRRDFGEASQANPKRVRRRKPEQIPEPNPLGQPQENPPAPEGNQQAKQPNPIPQSAEPAQPEKEAPSEPNQANLSERPQENNPEPNRPGQQSQQAPNPEQPQESQQANPQEPNQQEQAPQEPNLQEKPKEGQTSPEAQETAPNQPNEGNPNQNSGNPSQNGGNPSQNGGSNQSAPEPNQPGKSDPLSSFADGFKKWKEAGNSLSPETANAIAQGKNRRLVDEIFGKGMGRKLASLTSDERRAFLRYARGGRISASYREALIEKLGLSQPDETPNPGGGEPPNGGGNPPDGGGDEEGEEPPEPKVPNGYVEDYVDPTQYNYQFYEKDPTYNEDKNWSDRFESLKKILSSPLLSSATKGDPVLSGLIRAFGGAQSLMKGLESNWQNNIKKAIDDENASFDNDVYPLRQNLAHCNVEAEKAKKENEELEQELIKYQNEGQSADGATPEERQKKVDEINHKIKDNNYLIYQNTIDRGRRVRDRFEIQRDANGDYIYATSPATGKVLKDRNGNKIPLYVPEINPATGEPLIDSNGNPIYKQTKATVYAKKYEAREDELQNNIVKRCAPYAKRINKIPRKKTAEREDDKYYSRHYESIGLGKKRRRTPLESKGGN